MGATFGVMASDQRDFCRAVWTNRRRPEAPEMARDLGCLGTDARAGREVALEQATGNAPGRNCRSSSETISTPGAG